MKAKLHKTCLAITFREKHRKKLKTVTISCQLEEVIKPVNVVKTICHEICIDDGT